MAKNTLPCIFCPNPRTNKRGEHLWDDWLNRIGGKEIRDPSTTYYYGLAGKLIREHPSIRIDVTVDVVCDECNHTWMSDLTTRTKDLLEPVIRYDRPQDFNRGDIVTITSFAFMKSAVLDWNGSSSTRKPCISRTACLAFRNSLMSSTSRGDVALPGGLQVWIARYRRARRMEAQAFSEEMKGTRQFKGYRILVITYIAGSFIFQLTYPRWVKPTRKRTTAPFFQIFRDVLSVPIWPGVDFAYWPPLGHIDGRTLNDFRERFRRVRVLS